MNSLLIVDSQEVEASLLQKWLGRAGFEVEVADSTATALAVAMQIDFDLILTEFDLSPRSIPTKAWEMTEQSRRSWDGVDLIRCLRRANVTVPIIVHTVFEGELYERAALDAGADDFVTKRAPTSILMARIQSLVRRQTRDLGLRPPTNRCLKLGGFTLDRHERVLLSDDRAIALAPREMKVLEKLASNPLRIFPVSELLAVIANGTPSNPAALAGLLRRLRLKMNQNGFPNPVENYRAKGFRLSSLIALK